MSAASSAFPVTVIPSVPTNLKFSVPLRLTVAFPLASSAAFSAVPLVTASIDNVPVPDTAFSSPNAFFHLSASSVPILSAFLFAYLVLASSARLSNLSLYVLDNLTVTSVPLAVVSIPSAPFIPNAIPPSFPNSCVPVEPVFPSNLIVFVFNPWNWLPFIASFESEDIFPSPTFVKTLAAVSSFLIGDNL